MLMAFSGGRTNPPPPPMKNCLIRMALSLGATPGVWLDHRSPAELGPTVVSGGVVEMSFSGSQS